MASAERTAIRDALHSERFADLAPGEVWATLPDEGTYLGSVSTRHDQHEKGLTGHGLQRGRGPGYGDTP